jgi:hypothetical protein
VRITTRTPFLFHRENAVPTHVLQPPRLWSMRGTSRTAQVWTLVRKIHHQTAERMCSTKHNPIEDLKAMWHNILSNDQNHKIWSRRILYIVEQISNHWATSKSAYWGCRQTWSYIKHTTISYGFTTYLRSFNLRTDSKLRKNHSSTTDHLSAYIWACKTSRSCVKHTTAS